MSNLMNWLNGQKKELNRQLDRKRPEIVAAIRAEARRAREKGDSGDAFKDALIFLVDQKLQVFGPIELLVNGLIMGLPIKGKSLTEIEEMLVKKVQGARL